MSGVAQGIGNSMGVEAGVVAAPYLNFGTIGLKSRYIVECFDPEGNLKWEEDVFNIVFNAGLDDVLNKYFKGSAYTAAWYVGLKGTGSAVAADTMASHGGWAESTAYSNTNRPTLTLGSVSAQSVDNSASKAVFNINATATIAGGFLASDNTKGGTTGLLYGAADFAASRGVGTGDTLNVQVTLTTQSF